MPKHGTACDDRSLQPGWTTTPPGRLGAAASSCPGHDFHRPEDNSTICSLQDRPQAIDSRRPTTSRATTAGTKLDISTGGGGGAGTPADFDRPAARLLSEDAGSGAVAPPCEPRPDRHDGQATDTAAAFNASDQSASEPLPQSQGGPRHSQIRINAATDSSAFSHSRWRAPCSWLQFPPEIRNMIYTWSLQLPDSRTLYSSYYAPDPDSDPGPAHKPSGADQPPPLRQPFRPRLRTPTILLLCRLITAECLPILRSGWLVIDRPPPWPPGRPQPSPLTAFITPSTLQHLRRIDVRPSLAQGRFGSWWAWRGVVEELVAVLLERNCFAELRVLLKMHNVGRPNVWQAEWLGQKSLLKKIKELQSSNPRFWKPGLIRVEVWRVDEYEATKLHPGNLLENYELDLDRMEEIRSYPDAEFWPGSVLEFL